MALVVSGAGLGCSLWRRLRGSGGPISSRASRSRLICRELRVSRKVVRKVLRSAATEFHYEREQQPLRGLARGGRSWTSCSTANEAKAGRERLTLIRVFEALRGLGYEGGYDAVRRYARTLGAGPSVGDSGRRCAAEFRAGRGLPVRLEPRGRADQRHDGDGESRASAAVPQPDAVRARLSARDPGDGVRRARPRVRVLPGRLHARDLRQHENRGGRDLRRPRAGLQSPVPADVQPLPGRSGGLHPGVGLGERPGREPGRRWCASGSSRRGCGSRATRS